MSFPCGIYNPQLKQATRARMYEFPFEFLSQLAKRESWRKEKMAEEEEE
jgi:hypothetical protein